MSQANQPKSSPESGTALPASAFAKSSQAGSGKKMCRHCHKATVSRPRGLCWVDYYTPGIKELYPPTSKYAKKGEGNDFREGALPVPTAAPPGSLEKVAVLIARVKAREQLWHPDDETLATDSGIAARIAALLRDRRQGDRWDAGERDAVERKPRYRVNMDTLLSHFRIVG